MQPACEEADPVEPLLKVNELTMTYTGGHVSVCALDKVSFLISEGERIALLGKSGSGKTTLLNLLAGLDQPTQGEIVVEGQEISGMSRNQLARYRRRQIGMVFQSFNLVPTRTALQNVELPLVFDGCSPRKRRERAKEALSQVELSNRSHHLPTQLSGGQQQRVAIARALVNQPQLLFADEPTGNLDSETAGTIIELLLRCVDDYKMTLILVTHDEDLATRCADRILRMKDGRMEPQEVAL